MGELFTVDTLIFRDADAVQELEVKIINNRCCSFSVQSATGFSLFSLKLLLYLGLLCSSGRKWTVEDVKLTFRFIYNQTCTNDTVEIVKVC